MHADPHSETRSGTFYVPRDEEFSEVKEASFITKTADSVLHALIPSLETSLLDSNLGFPLFSDIDQLYKEGITIPKLKNQGLLRRVLPRLVKAVSEAKDDIVKFDSPAMFQSKKKPSHPHLHSCLSHIRTEVFLNLQGTSFLGFGIRNSHAKL